MVLFNDFFRTIESQVPFELKKTAQELHEEGESERKSQGGEERVRSRKGKERRKMCIE